MLFYVSIAIVSMQASVSELLNSYLFVRSTVGAYRMLIDSNEVTKLDRIYVCPVSMLEESRSYPSKSLCLILRW
jgi:hypothetical protein